MYTLLPNSAYMTATDRQVIKAFEELNCHIEECHTARKSYEFSELTEDEITKIEANLRKDTYATEQQAKNIKLWDSMKKKGASFWKVKVKGEGFGYFAIN